MAQALDFGWRSGATPAKGKAREQNERRSRGKLEDWRPGAFDAWRGRQFKFVERLHAFAPFVEMPGTRGTLLQVLQQIPFAGWSDFFVEKVHPLALFGMDHSASSSGV